MAQANSTAATGRSGEAVDSSGAPALSTTVREQARSVASRDVLWLFLALVIICIAENGRLQAELCSRTFTIFGVLFEMISAYGTVGLSLGYIRTVTSLSAQFSVVSKLVIIATMIAGRHRGLPFAVDSAVYLPTLLNTLAPVHEPPALTQQLSMALMTVAGTTTTHRLPNLTSLRDLFNAGTGGVAGSGVGGGGGGSTRMLPINSPTARAPTPHTGDGTAAAPSSCLLYTSDAADE